MESLELLVLAEVVALPYDRIWVLFLVLKVQKLLFLFMEMLSLLLFLWLLGERQSLLAGDDVSFSCVLAPADCSRVI